MIIYTKGLFMGTGPLRSASLIKHKGLSFVKLFFKYDDNILGSRDNNERLDVTKYDDGRNNFELC